MSNCLQEPPNNIAAYMKYLDKEMTIIAALTGATGGVFLYLVKEILKVDQTLAVQPVVPFLVVGLAALGVATLLSYLQRSYMIWCYGQITLAQCGRSDLERALDKADSWSFWLRYRLAFVSVGLAATELFLAVLVKTNAVGRIETAHCPWLYAFVLIFFAAVVGLQQYWKVSRLDKG